MIQTHTKNSRRASVISFLCCAAITIGTLQGVQAGGLMRDGVGAISLGRGGTNVAFADNGQVMLDNPGGLSNIRGDQLFEFGLDFLATELIYSDNENSQVGDVDNPFPAGQLSFAKRLNDSWTAGFGAFSQAGFSSEYMFTGQAPFTGQQHQKAMGALLRLLPTLSYQVNDRLSIGGTAGMGVSHIEIEGPYVFQGPSPFAGVPARVDVQGTGIAFSYSFGMQYQVNEKTTLGVSYQGETDFELRGSTKADIPVPPLGRGYYDSVINMSWPSALGVGLKHNLCACRTVGIDVLWYDWSHAFDSFDLDLSNGTGPVATLGTGPSIQESLPLNWRDVVEIRTGYQHDLGCGRTFRTGYIYHRNPIPASTLTPYIPPVHEHAVSFGYGWRAKKHRIDLGYSYAFGPDQSVGTSGLIGNDYDNSTVTAYVHWLTLSIQKL